MCIRDILFIITEFLGFVKKFAGNGGYYRSLWENDFFSFAFCGRCCMIDNVTYDGKKF